MHLDARLRVVEQRHVAPLAHVEIRPQQRVQVAQQVQVEGGRDTQCVVIGCLQHTSRLDQVHANQQRATGRHRVRLAQQRQRACGVEVADAGPRVEHQGAR
eukprot:gene19652-27828_t